MKENTNSEKSNDAETKLQKVLAERLSNMANEMLVDGKSEQARDVAMAATLLDPANAKWHVGLAIVESFMGDVQSARSSFEIALSIDPEHTNALHLLGNIYRMDGELDKATELLERDLAVHERKGHEYDPQVVGDLCETYIQARKNDQARSLIQRYIKVHPKDEDLLHIRDRLNLQ